MRRLNYIHELKNWPDFNWNRETLLSQLASVRYMQGKLLGKMEALGFRLKEEAVLETVTLDVLKSTEIEGEFLNMEQVRSSVARKLGMNIKNMVRSERHIDGVVEMMVDATQNFNKPLTRDRLFAWHSALFPAGRPGMQKLIVGAWRDDSTGLIQVVSGAMGKERVHFEAPAAKVVNKEMQQFIKWFNAKDNLDPVLKSAIAHIWFLTIHPFEDGNGRMARALSDLLLARADQTAQRFYSMSAQIRTERNRYYFILEKTQKGNLDITEWIAWFFLCIENSLRASDKLLGNVLAKSAFWQMHTQTSLNDRQKKIVNRLFDGFDGNLTSTKWAKINKCSADTALRDIQDLVKKQVLLKALAGGRSTTYELNI